MARVKIAGTSGASENTIVFSPAGGHSHNGRNSSLIDSTAYSIYDFSPTFVGTEVNPDRAVRQENNRIAFEDVIKRVVNNSVLAPAGIRLEPGSLNGSLIIANTITANQLAANTITADEIAAGTITANQLSSNIVLVNNIIRSNNYNGTIAANGVITANGTAGWAITSAGFAEFANTSIRGSVIANSVSTPGIDLNSDGSISSTNFNVTASGNITANNATIIGSINAGSSITLGSPVNFSVNSSGSVTANTGKIGPVNITTSSMNSQNSSPYLNASTNYYNFDNFGDIYVYSNPGSDIGGPHVNQFHSTALVGEYIQIKKTSTSAFSDNLYEARIGDTTGTYAEVVVQNPSTSSYVAMYSTGNMTVTGTINGYGFTSGRHNTANLMVHTDGNGYLQVGYINSSNGNEGNNSNPSRVWGTNGSDDYLRSYLTSALSVGSAGYATSAGSATTATYATSAGSATTATTASFAYCGNNQIPAKASYNSTSLVGIMQTGSSTTARLSTGDSGNTYQELKAPTSRRYLKENIQDINDALSILNAIRPRKFNWKIDAFNKSDPFTQESWTNEAKTINQLSFTYGFIAEEIFEDRPDLAVLSHGSPQIPRDQEGGLYDLNSWEPVMWKEIDMIPISVKAIQEISAKLDIIEARLQALEGV